MQQQSDLFWVMKKKYQVLGENTKELIVLKSSDESNIPSDFAISTIRKF